MKASDSTEVGGGTSVPEPGVLRKQTLQRLAEAAVQVSWWPGKRRSVPGLVSPDGPGCVGLVTPWLGLQRSGLFDKLILNLFSWRTVGKGLFSTSLGNANVRLDGGEGWKDKKP